MPFSHLLYGLPSRYWQIGLTICGLPTALGVSMTKEIFWPRYIVQVLLVMTKKAREWLHAGTDAERMRFCN